MALKIFLILILALSLLPGVIVGLTRGRFYLPFLLLLSLYTISVPIRGNLDNFDLRTVVVASLYAAVCNGILSGFLVALDWKLLGKSVIQPLKYEHPATFEILFIALSALLLTLTIWAGIDSALLDVWSQRAIGGGLSTTLKTYTVFVLFCTWPTLRNRAVIILAIPVLIFGFMTTGARVMMFAGAGYMIYFLMVRYSLRAKLFLIPIGLTAAFAMHIVTRTIRGVGIGSLFSGQIDYGRLFVFSGMDLSGGESEISKALLYSVQSVLDGSWHFEPLVTIRRLIFFFVPTREEFSLIKPKDLTYQLWDFAYVNGYFNYNTYLESLRNNFLSFQSGSLHPTIWGDGLLNMGWAAALIWPALVAALMISIEKWLTKRRRFVDPRILAGAAAPALMYVVRGNVYLGILMLIVGGAMAYLVTQLARPKRLKSFRP